MQVDMNLTRTSAKSQQNKNTIIKWNSTTPQLFTYRIYWKMLMSDRTWENISEH